MDLAFENLHLTIINNNVSSYKLHMTVDVNIMNVLGSHRIYIAKVVNIFFKTEKSIIIPVSSRRVSAMSFL